MSTPATCTTSQAAPPSARAAQQALVRRDWYEVLECRVDADTHGGAHGNCPHCGTSVAGRFGAFGGSFGRRRIPVRLAA